MILFEIRFTQKNLFFNVWGQKFDIATLRNLNSPNSQRPRPATSRWVLHLTDLGCQPKSNVTRGTVQPTPGAETGLSPSQSIRLRHGSCMFLCYFNNCILKNYWITNWFELFKLTVKLWFPSTLHWMYPCWALSEIFIMQTCLEICMLCKIIFM